MITESDLHELQTDPYHQPQRRRTTRPHVNRWRKTCVACGQEYELREAHMGDFYCSKPNCQKAHDEAEKAFCAAMAERQDFQDQQERSHLRLFPGSDGP